MKISETSFLWGFVLLLALKVWVLVGDVARLETDITYMQVYLYNKQVKEMHNENRSNKLEEITVLTQPLTPAR